MNFATLLWGFSLVDKMVYKGKLHLNQKGKRVLSDIYLRKISKILNWYETGNFSGFEEYMSENSPISIDEKIVKVF